LSHYPSRYSEIIRECGEEGKRVTASFPSAEKALSLRGHYYAFLGALKREADALERAGGLLSLEDAAIVDLAKVQPRVMLTVRTTGDGTTYVIWENREQSWQAQALAAATVEATDAAPMTPAGEGGLARLMQLQQAVDKGDDNG
jgi:hypothetical protein